MSCYLGSGIRRWITCRVVLLLSALNGLHFKLLLLSFHIAQPLRRRNVRSVHLTFRLCFMLFEFLRHRHQRIERKLLHPNVFLSNLVTFFRSLRFLNSYRRLFFWRKRLLRFLFGLFWLLYFFLSRLAFLVMRTITESAIRTVRTVTEPILSLRRRL